MSSIRAMSSPICPRCGRNDVRQSARRGVGDRFMALIGLAPYRCRACRNRFFRFRPGNGNGIGTGNGNGVQPVVDVGASIVQATVEPVSVEPASPLDLRPVAVHPLASLPVAYSLLIVSRDPAIRKLLCKLLTRPGYHTHELDDVSQLPSELRARKVDLVIADLDEPEQQGLETLAALRGVYPNLQIIALSALSVARVPGSIVLSKPFHREVLLESVQSALVETAQNRLPAVSTMRDPILRV